MDTATNGASLARDRRLFLMICATVGFGLLQGARFIDVNSGPYSSHALALLGLFVDGGTLLVVALFSYFGKIENEKLLFVAGAVACCLYLMLSFMEYGNFSLAIALQVCAGLMWSLNILCWMSVFTSYKPRHALVMISLAYSISVLVKPIIGFVGLPVDGALAVFSAASIALLGVCLRWNAAIAREVLKEESAFQKEKVTTTLPEAFSRTRRAVACTVVFSFVCGFVIESDLLETGMEYAQSNGTAIVCIVVSILMTLVLVVLSVDKANIDYMCPIAAAWISSALFARSMGLLDDAASGCLMTATLISFYVLLWLMLVSEAHERKLPSFFLLGLALGAARLSVMAGRATADWVVGDGVVAPLAVGALCLWVLAMAMAAVFFSFLRYSSKRQRGIFEECSAEDIDSEFALAGHAEEADRESQLSLADADEKKGASLNVVGDSGEMSWDAAVDALVEQYALSDREAQIVREYAAGRSARYLAEWYMLSEHTVKTHLRRAYSKIDVHSRQELIDAIEEMRAESYRKQE